MLLGSYYLARARSPLAAYNALQLQLMRRFLGRGGTEAEWVARFAEPFHRRFGWMLAERDAA